MQKNPDYKQYIEKYVRGTISSKEMEYLLSYFENFGFPEDLDEALFNEFQKKIPFEKEVQQNFQPIFDRVDHVIVENLIGNSSSKPLIRKINPVFCAAAAVILISLFWISKELLWNSTNPKVSYIETTIFPAGNKAHIQLSDGRIIELDENENGIVIQDDEIAYENGDNSIFTLKNNKDVEYLSLSTPRGGTYQMTLSDGTKVWLNAESTLKYPSRFIEKERLVHLTGEAYFEVTPKHNSRKESVPFKVVSLGQTVEVLGTEFNISAYQDEQDVKTTLVGGSVKVMKNQTPADEAIYLQPGEQSQVSPAQIKIAKVDVNDYVDWKMGLFVFRNENTYQVLQRIARWYDVQFEFTNQNQHTDKFSGSISRYDKLSTVLDIMKEASDLEFKIENRTIIVE